MTQVLYALCLKFRQLITVLHVGKKQAAGSLESQDRDVNTILCPPCFFNVVPSTAKQKADLLLYLAQIGQMHVMSALNNIAK